MKKIALFLTISLNLCAIDFLFKNEIIECENFIDRRIFCSWGIGKTLDIAKDSFKLNTRLKFNYIFSKNRIRVDGNMVFQRLSRNDEDYNKFYSCHTQSFVKKDGYFFYKKYCDVIEFHPEKIEINPNQERINKRFELLKTQGWDAFQKDVIKELANEHKEKMRKEKVLQQKLFEEYKREYYKNKGKQ